MDVIEGIKEVIIKNSNASYRALGYIVDENVLAQALHDAGYRRVPSEEELRGVIIDTIAEKIGTTPGRGKWCVFDIASAIRKFMLEGEE